MAVDTPGFSQASARSTANSIASAASRLARIVGLAFACLLTLALTVLSAVFR